MSSTVLIRIMITVFKLECAALLRVNWEKVDGTASSLVCLSILKTVGIARAMCVWPNHLHQFQITSFSSYIF